MTAYDDNQAFIWNRKFQFKAKKNFFIKFYQRHCSSDKSNMLLVPLFCWKKFSLLPLKVYLFSRKCPQWHPHTQQLYWIQACSPTWNSFFSALRNFLSSCVTQHMHSQWYKVWMKNCVFRAPSCLITQYDGDDDKTIWVKRCV